MTPTQRSLAKLRREGWPLVEITERWVPASPAGFKGPIVRHDLFGFVDILCVRNNDMLAVQTTSGANMAARVDKIRFSPKAAVWLESPNRKIVVHGWRMVGKRGKRKLWECREVWI